MFAIDLHPPIFLAIYAFIFLIILLTHKKKSTKYTLLSDSICALYILLLIKVAIFPIIILRPESRIAFQENISTEYVQLYNIVPFNLIGTLIRTADTGAWKLQLLGNILMLAPIPVLLSLRTKKSISVHILLGIGALVSLSIELVQYSINLITQFPSRDPNIDDFILNIIGVAFAVIVIKHIESRPLFSRIKSLSIKGYHY